jgi:hypothetical protein
MVKRATLDWFQFDHSSEVTDHSNLHESKGDRLSMDTLQTPDTSLLHPFSFFNSLLIEDSLFLHVVNLLMQLSQVSISSRFPKISLKNEGIRFRPPRALTETEKIGVLSVRKVRRIERKRQFACSGTSAILVSIERMPKSRDFVSEGRAAKAPWMTNLKE